MRKKQKNKANQMLKIIIIFCIGVAIILGIIIASLKFNNKQTEISDEQIENQEQQTKAEVAKKTEESVIIDRLAQMGERDRIEYYFSTFIDAIEKRKYDEAYEMLYEDFKTNYFPTLEEFTTYAEKTFPKLASIEHTNFERNGQTYILFITISNSLSTSKEGREMKFVVKENAVNDFVMSFSVI